MTRNPARLRRPVARIATLSSLRPFIGHFTRVVAAGCAAGALALPAAADPNAAAGTTAAVEGHVRVVAEGLALADAGAVVVFLEALDGRAADEAANRALAPATVRQNGARFDPTFLVVARGQQVEMPNDDVIFHNVFSYSEPNAFDLGMYASGQSRSIRFEHSGLVRIYCSIHDSMDGLIFVAPTRHFARVDAAGRYALGDVRPGRYRIHVWSERLPERTLGLTLAPGDARSVDLAIGQTGG